MTYKRKIRAVLSSAIVKETTTMNYLVNMNAFRFIVPSIWVQDYCTRSCANSSADEGCETWADEIKDTDNVQDFISEVQLVGHPIESHII